MINQINDLRIGCHLSLLSYRDRKWILLGLLPQHSFQPSLHQTAESGWDWPPPSSRCGPITPTPVTALGMGRNLGLQQLVQGILWPQWLFQWVQPAWHLGLVFPGGKVTPQPFSKGLFLATVKVNTKLREWQNESNWSMTEAQPTIWTSLLHMLMHCLYGLIQFEPDLLMF